MENVVELPAPEMSKDIADIAGALSQAQAELESAKKTESGYGYNYSNLAEVISSSRPVLAKHGLAVTQLVGNTNENVSVTTILTHKSGQFFKSIATIPLVEMKGCNVAQRAGASLSYLRRYAYQSIIGQPSEDNDGSSEGFTAKKKASDFKKSEAKEEAPKKRTRFKDAKSAGTL